MLDIRATHYISPLSEVDFASVHLTVHLANLADETGLVTGTFRVYNATTGLLIHTSDIAPLSMPASAAVDVSALTDFDPPAPADDAYFVIFDGHASNALVPAGIDFTLGKFDFDVKPSGMGPAPAAHHATHANGGSDEIDVTDLSGLLADPQTPDTHADSHKFGGADEIEIADMATAEPDDTLVLQPDGAGGVEWVAPSAPAADVRDRFHFLFQNDCLGVQNASGVDAPWYTTTDFHPKLPGEPNHPGIQVANLWAENSGAAIVLDHIDLLLAGTEYSTAVFQPDKLDGLLAWLGLLDNDDSAPVSPVDGVYFEIQPVGGTDGVLVGRTSAAGVKSTTATSYTLLAGTWYCARVSLNADASIATFTLYSEAGAVLWTDTLNTNIPTSPGNETNAGAVVFNTIARMISFDFLELDYIDVGMTRLLVR